MTNLKLFWKIKPLKLESVKEIVILYITFPKLFLPGCTVEMFSRELKPVFFTQFKILGFEMWVPCLLAAFTPAAYFISVSPVKEAGNTTSTL